MRKIVYIIAWLAATAALGQSKLPTLGDHVFVPQDAIKNPQPVSFFSMTVGLQESDDFPIDIGIPSLIGAGQLNGEIVFADIGVKASVRLKDWISWRVSYNAVVRVGTDIPSVLVQGINSIAAYESLWQIRVLHLPKFTMATTFGFNRIDGDFVDIAGLVESIRNGDPNPSANKKVRSLTGEVGLSSAYAVNSVIGIMLEGDVEIGDHVDVQNARVFWRAAASIDFNFNERYNFPLGIAVTGHSTTLPEFVVPTRRQAFGALLRFAYTGSDVFAIGLATGNSWFPLERVDDRTTFTGFQLNGRFFF